MTAERAVRIATAALAVLVAGLMVRGALVMPRAPRVGELVDRHLAESGVIQPVTAVLLNFRAYDTLVEVAVLLMAAVGIHLLAPVGRASPVATEPLALGSAVTPVANAFGTRLAPMALLMAAHLWWAGSTQPGGAFQGGTVLAGAAVGLILTGRLPFSARRWWLRTGMAIGLFAFLLAAVGPVGGGAAFLEYPPGLAYGIIVAVEGMLTLSIGLCLAALVVGVPPRRPPDAGRAPWTP
ncbi:Na(+)/H(+) antiporter subunit B [Azospirillum halopraeferens]|uniref:Na(+)/H(+) antiporter subunit B n=1 Tax=Azospirillum halopraeferens TaxID=34010 RepID=UPI0003FFB5FC|nr:Na(+)/H(+) antiporter subunit B [Azospirillum halopraeferens]